MQNEIQGGAPTGFRGLHLSAPTLAALERAGFVEPSPVQAQLIPPALAGKDCIGNAPTGTGKTAAFLLPIIEDLDDADRRLQALILVPTRELAHQIGREFARLSLGRKARAVAVVGGESMHTQIRLIRSGAQVVIATPGRLMDLMRRDAIRFDAVTTVVLDEADQMLDIGFRDDVEAILDAVPRPRQTLLLSATMPAAVRDLAKKYLNDPADVRLIREDADATIPAIRQSYIMVRNVDRLGLLAGLIERDQPARALIFCRTRIGADRLGEQLRERGVRAEAMHGDLSQSRRNRVLDKFRAGRLTTLVATDVVGRGIDVPGISHVFNYDVPEDPEHYVHRIGRTGRMGRDGVAYTFVMPDQGQLLDQIEKAISRDLDRGELEGVFSPPRPMGARRPPQGGRSRAPFRGNRPSGPRRGEASFGGPRRRRLGPPQRVG